MGKSGDKIKTNLFYIGLLLFVCLGIFGLCGLENVAFVFAMIFAYYVIGIICTAVISHMHPELDTGSKVFRGYLWGMFFFIGILMMRCQ